MLVSKASKSFLTAKGMCFLFSSLSSQLQSASYRFLEFKTSNIHFSSNGISIVPYFRHPLLQIDTSQLHYKIRDSGVLTLNFLQESSEEFSKSAWENRKNIYLNFREAYTLLKVPNEEKEISIVKKEESKDGNSNTYVRKLKVTNSSEKQEVEISLRENTENSLTNINDNMWEIVTTLPYYDYFVLTESIRTNLLFISGAKFAIEITKEESIVDLDSFKPIQTPTKQYKFTKQTYEGQKKSRKSKEASLEKSSKKGKKKQEP